MERDTYMANPYIPLVQKVVKTDADLGVKDGLVFPAVILGVCMFICGLIVIAFFLASLFGGK